METVAKNFGLIIAAPLLLPIIWIYFWGCNLAVWALSFGFSFTDVIFSSLPSGPSFAKVIGFCFDGIWFYFAAFCAAMFKMRDEDGGSDFSLSSFLTIVAAVTILVIVIYDPRIAPELPGFLCSPIQYMQEHWNFRLVGAFSWASMNFSGKVSDPFFYTVFDIGMVLSFLFVAFATWAKEN